MWVAPCPVPRAQSRGAAKDKRRQNAHTQARTRALTPLLPAYLAAAHARMDWGQRLLQAAQDTPEGETFVVDGVHYTRRPITSRYGHLRPSQDRAEPPTFTPLLERIDSACPLTGAVITLDALHARTGDARRLYEHGAHYAFIVSATGPRCGPGRCTVSGRVRTDDSPRPLPPFATVFSEDGRYSSWCVHTRSSE